VPRATTNWLARLAIVSLLVGVGAGVAGLLVTAFLHAIQHVAYGYSEGTFLDGLRQASPATRVIALTVAGLIGALGWWALRRWARSFVSIEQSVSGSRMPTFVTLVNAALQVVIVGLGASIGRELAPRELGALVAGWLSERAGLSSRERRILVACGAGAGLAAVYNVPLAGAVFAIEILLAEVSISTVGLALGTAGIATLVARIVVPATPLYDVPQFTLSASMVAWSVIVGPLMGLGALGFVRFANRAREWRPKARGILLVMPATFAAVGAVSLAFPEILGNGRVLGQIAFDAVDPLSLLAALVVLKVVVTVGTIGSGAAGGTLTPSLAIGAALGALAGAAWDVVWPGVPVGAFALIGAAAFLSSSMRAPLTALVLVIEFTDQGPSILVPMILAVVGSVAASSVLRDRRLTGVD